jgi:hypothetical protein
MKAGLERKQLVCIEIGAQAARLQRRVFCDVKN